MLKMVFSKAATKLIREVAAFLFQDTKTPNIPEEFRYYVSKFMSDSYMKRVLSNTSPTILRIPEMNTIMNVPNKPETINKYVTDKELELYKKETKIGKIGLPIILYNRRSNKRWLVAGMASYATNIRERKTNIKVIQVDC